MLLKELRLVPITTLAEAINLTPTTVRKRIKRKEYNAITLTQRDYRMDKREIDRILSNDEALIKIEQDIEITKEALTTDDIASILSINKEIAGRYAKKYMNAKGFKSLRISQSTFLEYLKERQQIDK
jgi:DNA-binding Lrp family transcriptional regulator